MSGPQGYAEVRTPPAGGGTAARWCSCSLEAGAEIPHLDYRENPQGRPQPASKPERAPSADSPVEPEIDLANVDMAAGRIVRNLDDERVSGYLDTMPRFDIPDQPPGLPPARRAADKRKGDSVRARVELSLSTAGSHWAGDVEQDCRELRGLAITAQMLDDMTRAEVAKMRDEGASWAEIGRALGVTRQAAHERYGVKRA